MANQKLYVARRERRLRQRDLAKMLNISVDAYYRKEKGKNPFNQTEMIRLAKIFDCTLDDLFWEEAK